MGKKYIVELEDNESVYKTIIANGYPMIQVIVPAPYAEPDLEQVREEAYDKGYDDAAEKIGSDEQAIADKAYKNGLSDAWEAARKIYNFDLEEREELFHDSERFNVGSICEAYSASEAIEKIRQYEQEKGKIQVGDEVIPRETEYDTMVVTRLWKDDYDSDCIDAIGFDGRIGSFLVSRVSKTGKHYEIAEVLQKMKEADNG